MSKHMNYLIYDLEKKNNATVQSHMATRPNKSIACTVIGDRRVERLNVCKKSPKNLRGRFE